MISLIEMQAVTEKLIFNSVIAQVSIPHMAELASIFRFIKCSFFRQRRSLPFQICDQCPYC